MLNYKFSPQILRFLRIYEYAFESISILLNINLKFISNRLIIYEILNLVLDTK